MKSSARCAASASKPPSAERTAERSAFVGPRQCRGGPKSRLTSTDGINCSFMNIAPSLDENEPLGTPAKRQVTTPTPGSCKGAVTERMYVGLTRVSLSAKINTL